MLGCKYQTFKVLGVFLCYPTSEWFTSQSILLTILEDEKLLSPENINAIRIFSEWFGKQDLLEAQERYVETFDRTRSLSLHLFEHVHGESRDRGQAMIDLLDIYKEQGFILSPNELPDYLPVFLEYLSAIDKEEAIDLLTDPAHIFIALGKRLAERGSPYAVLLNALIQLSGNTPATVEKIDAHTAVAFSELDKEWEDKLVDLYDISDRVVAPTLGGCGDKPVHKNGGCGSGSGCGGCGGSYRSTQTMKES